jgi:hypothetical protein
MEGDFNTLGNRVARQTGLIGPDKSAPRLSEWRDLE